MKGIIFDMDGVIFDTERVGDQAWRQAAEEMGFAQIDDAISQCRGLNRADTKAFFEGKYPDLDYLAFHKRNHEIMNQLLADGMPVKTGAVELLHWLRQEEWRVALATSTGRESTMHHLEAAHMTDLFDAIITGEQVEHGKPDPEIYEMACDAIGATAGLSFAVEDSPNGIHSAAAANLRVIMVPDLVNPNLELRELVVTVQENLLGVQKFLEKFGEV